ncbi:hypothetical protein HHK36_021318 [Tetracentron sinense]|uniref:WD repeat-containing protein 76 n=1 Tax=Tetracentron sinense TaxID=13715 RepID=A0A835D9T1_TETSI|nr:hypothetical protein HHK36_021318 [Tetracentron sinense]
MATQNLTEYERQRLENIKRNDEMMASLKLQSRLNELSSATKRQRIETKSFKISPEKEPKSKSPIVIRRSLRARGMPPDFSSSKGLEGDFVASMLQTPKSSIQPKASPRELGPLSMEEAYSGTFSDRKLIDTIMGMSRNSPLCCSFKREFCKEEVSQDPSSSFFIKSEINGDEDFNCVMKGMPENASLSYSINVKFEGDGGSYDTKDIRENAQVSCLVKPENIFDLQSLILKPENIARILPGKILNLRFLPSNDGTMIVVGDKYGNTGFWNTDCMEEEGDGIYLYHPHSGPISGISVQPLSLSKIFTSCYDGFIRLMDVEKEAFNLVYSSDNAIFSLSQQPHDEKSLYFSEGCGVLNSMDERAGKCSSSWTLHDERINSIDFNSRNMYLMATSSSDRTACIWDLRNIDANKPKPLKMVDHKRAVHSAYFSPTGSCLATTSFDNNIRLLGGVDLVDISMIHHDNQTGRWIPSFRAIWGWDDSYVFIGNMKRGVDVISTANKKTTTLSSPHMSAIPCRFASHPYKVGTLAGATAGGQIYIWTTR